MSFFRSPTLRRIAHNALRVVAGFMFLQHGAQKLFGWLGGFGGTPGQTAELMSLMGLAGVLEFFGGALILLGLLTRPVAFLLAGQMAVAYFRAHAPQGFWTIQNGGELAALYAFVFLLLVAIGPGSVSLDAALGIDGEEASGSTAGSG